MIPYIFLRMAGISLGLCIIFGGALVAMLALVDESSLRKRWGEQDAPNVYRSWRALCWFAAGTLSFAIAFVGLFMLSFAVVYR